MTSFRHILRKIEKVEEALLPERKTIVIVEDKRKGTLYVGHRKFNSESELTKWLDSQPNNDTLRIVISPTLIVEPPEGWK